MEPVGNAVPVGLLRQNALDITPGVHSCTAGTATGDPDPGRTYLLRPR